VSALTILQAGKWAPLALLIVAAVLYLYRKIYAEVVKAAQLVRARLGARKGPRTPC